VSTFEDNLSSIITVYNSHATGWPVSTVEEIDLREKIKRYYGAVLRFLMVITRHDEDMAVDCASDFAVRFLEGKYERFDPKRGRFRDYLKECLRNLVRDRWRKIQGRREREQALPDSNLLPPGDEPPSNLVERAFSESFSNELINRAWASLSEHEKTSGTPYHTVLFFKSQHADQRSAELAGPLSERLGKTLTENNVRQLVHRARQKFAELLVADVRFSLGEATPEQLEQELRDLDLLKYCKPILPLT
jgi:RNA polymerase sigma-70 factor (ECF subfamily)